MKSDSYRGRKIEVIQVDGFFIGEVSVYDVKVNQTSSRNGLMYSFTGLESQAMNSAYRAIDDQELSYANMLTYGD